jgi:hypothetical protein
VLSVVSMVKKFLVVTCVIVVCDECDTGINIYDIVVAVFNEFHTGSTQIDYHFGLGLMAVNRVPQWVHTIEDRLL